MNEEIHRALDRAAEKVVKHAKARAAVDTGEMKAKIGYQKRGNTRIIGSAAKHAKFVELGTRYQRAQPFLVPAAKSIQK